MPLIFPKLTEVERNRVVFANLSPTLSLVVLSEFLLYLILYADSAGSHRMAMGYLVRPAPWRSRCLRLRWP